MTGAFDHDELRQLTALCRKLADGPQAGERRRPANGAQAHEA